MMRHAASLTPSAWVTRFAPLIAAGGEVLEISCDYCRKEYAVEPSRLRGLLETS